jgi:hypothetical protein
MTSLEGCDFYARWPRIAWSRLLLRCPLLTVLLRCIPLDRARSGHAFISRLRPSTTRLVVLVLVVMSSRDHHFISSFHCATKRNRIPPPVGEVLSSVAVGQPVGPRSALDRFSETSTLDRRVRGGVPPHPLASAERLLLNFPPPMASPWCSSSCACGFGCCPSLATVPAASRRAWLACRWVRWCGCHRWTGPGRSTARPAAAPSRSGGSASEPKARTRETCPQVARSKRGRAFPCCPGRALPLNTNPANAHATHAAWGRTLPLGRFPFTCPARLDRWRWPMPAPSLFLLLLLRLLGAR